MKKYDNKKFSENISKTLEINTINISIKEDAWIKFDINFSQDTIIKRIKGKSLYQIYW